jgi:hypothetical protein
MKSLLLFLMVGALMFVSAVGGAVMGALGGWLVGWIFDDTMRLAAQAFGIPGAAPYQLGAMAGFFGGFFRATLHNLK